MINNNSHSFLAQNSLLRKRERYDAHDNNLRLRQAAREGDLEEVNRLLHQHNLEKDAAARGINPITNKPYSAATALHQAVIGNHHAVVVRLIKAGWSIYCKNIDQKTPLDLAKDPKLITTIQQAYGIQHFSKRLEIIFNALNLEGRLKLSKEEPIRVLSLACGLAFEAPVLQQLYPHRKIHFTGVDIESDCCTESQEICSELDNVEFITADATDVKKLRYLFNKERFDLVIIRQPDIFNRRQIFTDILSKTVPAMIKATGVVFISTYHKEELIEVVQLMKKEFLNIPNSFCELGDHSQIIINGAFLSPDSYSQLMVCSPALQETIQAEANSGLNLKR
ncbi:MAG: hypothetical protein LEGION0403_FIIPPAGN_02514 [Legionella sp.]|uniref:methyltransferase domain-containing protein n=1 Tax=Legionella sp. TaxID=459 RepID=UPI003D145CA6